MLQDAALTDVHTLVRQVVPENVVGLAIGSALTVVTTTVGVVVRTLATLGVVANPTDR